MDDTSNHRILNRFGSDEHRNWMVQNFKSQIDAVVNKKKSSEDLAKYFADKFIKLEVERVRDPLTGAFNRSLIGAVLKREIELQTRLHSGLGFMFMDLDYFKSVNDNEPDKHQAGDRVLVEFTKILRQICGDRQSLVGRWGGEEFVVVIPQASIEHMRAVGLDIGESVMGWLAKNARLERVSQTVSIGACLARNHDTAVGLIQRADQLLYQAKEGGRNRMVLDLGGKIEVVQFK